MSSSPDNTTLVEQLAPGVTLEWLCDRRIIAMSAADSSRTSVDAWINRAMEIVKGWPEGQPYLVMVDASQPKQTRTPYARSRLNELMSLRPDLRWCVAMIAPQNYLMQLFRLAALVPRGNKEMRVYFNRDEALKWLQSRLSEDNTLPR